MIEPGPTAFDAERGIRHGQRAVVIHPDLAGRGPDSREVSARLEEAVGLAAAIGLNVVHAEIIRVRERRPATLLGTGQVERVAAAVAANDAELVVMDGVVSPVQQKNLEEGTKAKVIDRTGLILEIFGERAATREGTLQVELAHLDYQQGRLVRSWTHLERQRGGFGFLGGPGETQIETDRRLIRERMAKLKRELEDVKRTRALHRRRRQKAPYPTVALVGYTNAGKSTLFNRLTGADVMAENLLFATLDPTMRRVSLPGFDQAILSDTVGFVSALPTQLVAAFRATLEEVLEADLIVHVRDVAHPDTDAQKADVMRVLGDLGVTEGEGAIPILEALNKIDLLDGDRRVAVLGRADADTAALSALSGEGVDAFTQSVSARLRGGARVLDLVLHPADGQRLAWLYAHGEVITREDDGGDIRVRVRMSESAKARFDLL